MLQSRTVKKQLKHAVDRFLSFFFAVFCTFVLFYSKLKDTMKAYFCYRHALL